MPWLVSPIRANRYARPFTVWPKTPDNDEVEISLFDVHTSPPATLFSAEQMRFMLFPGTHARLSGLRTELLSVRIYETFDFSFVFRLPCAE